MGKGDRKTRRGKIFRGSYGKTRPHGPKGGAKDTGESKPAKKKAPAKKRPAARSKAKK